MRRGGKGAASLPELTAHALAEKASFGRSPSQQVTSRRRVKQIAVVYDCRVERLPHILRLSLARHIREVPPRIPARSVADAPAPASHASAPRPLPPPEALVAAIAPPWVYRRCPQATELPPSSPRRPPLPPRPPLPGPPPSGPASPPAKTVSSALLSLVQQQVSPSRNRQGRPPRRLDALCVEAAQAPPDCLLERDPAGQALLEAPSVAALLTQARSGYARASLSAAPKPSAMPKAPRSHSFVMAPRRVDLAGELRELNAKLDSALSARPVGEEAPAQAAEWRSKLQRAEHLAGARDLDLLRSRVHLGISASLAPGAPPRGLRRHRDREAPPTTSLGAPHLEEEEAVTEIERVAHLEVLVMDRSPRTAGGVFLKSPLLHVPAPPVEAARAKRAKRAFGGARSRSPSGRMRSRDTSSRPAPRPFNVHGSSFLVGIDQDFDHEDAVALFDSVDKDLSGIVSKAELIDALQADSTISSQPKLPRWSVQGEGLREFLEEMFNSFSTSSDQFITRAEWVRAMERKPAHALEEGRAEWEAYLVKWKNINAVFRRLRDTDGEMHKDNLGKSLELLGYSAPARDSIATAHAQVSSYSTLNFEEFVDFVNKYGEFQGKLDLELFEAFDEDGSGQVDFTELCAVLEHLGITPMRHVVGRIVSEVCDTEDLQEAELTYDQFKKLMHILRAREGHTQEEVAEFKAAFHRFDVRKDGELHTQELASAIFYLGYAMDEKKIEAIGRELDVDLDSKGINEREFLVCLRKVREREISHIKRLLVGQMGITPAAARRTSVVEMRIKSNTLRDVLLELGYQPMDEGVSDAAEDAGLVHDSKGRMPDQLRFEELWRFLEVYRRRNGFSREEDKQIDAAFKSRLGSQEHDGTVDAAVVGNMFRAIGLHASYTRLQQLVAEIDIYGSHTISLREFKMLVRKFYTWENQKLWVAFCNATGSEDEVAELEPEVCLVLLRRVFPEQVLEVCMQVGALEHAKLQLKGFDDLVGITQEVRKVSCQMLRDNVGFTPTEVDTLRERFHAFDADGSGEIDGTEFTQMLKELLPGLATNGEWRPELIKLMQEVDSDADTKLNFREFIAMVRRFHELYDGLTLTKERGVIKEAGFSLPEVWEFRRLFLDNTDRDQVTFDELVGLLSGVVPLGDKNLKALNKTTKEILNHGRPGEVDRRLRFWEFLLLMRHLLDSDFAGIATLRGGAAESQQ